MEQCTACSGSGYYDSTGSPECEACNGTGEIEMSQSGTHLISIEIPLELAQHLLESVKIRGRINLSLTDIDIMIDALKDAINQDDA